MEGTSTHYNTYASCFFLCMEGNNCHHICRRAKSDNLIFAAPSAPPNLVGVTKVTSSSITVQWGAVDCIHHNGDITGYSVRYGVKGSEKVETVGVSSEDTQTTIRELLPNTLYEIHIAAVNSVGEGVDSKPIEGMKIPIMTFIKLYYH